MYTKRIKCNYSPFSKLPQDTINKGRNCLSHSLSTMEGEDYFSLRDMERDQNKKVEDQLTSNHSDTVHAREDAYTFVFQNDEQEKVRTIAANVLRRYPNCMLSRMVNSLVSKRRTADGGYIIKVQNLEMLDHIINFMQRKFQINIISFLITRIRA